MSVRTSLLVLSTTTLSVLVGCTTPQKATREDTAVSTSAELAQRQPRGCACAHHTQAIDGSAQSEAGKGCGCPHCAKVGKASADKTPACGCSRQGQDGQEQVRDSE
jgi:hypothetical protein